MQIRKACVKDLNAILKMYYNARIFMAISGNKNQWINGYPDEETVLSDIENNALYVVEKDSIICAVFLFNIGVDETYNQIDGAWLNNEPYAYIHRVASNGTVSGVTRLIFDWCKERCNSIRIDTHSDNLVMQNTVLSNGFLYCGIILTHNGTERLAYQWIKN